MLTTGYWPTQQPAQIQLPTTAQAAFTEFKSFYLNKHSGRQLTLQANMGNADLNAVFYGTKKAKPTESDDTAQSSSQVAEKPKERKHILSVWIGFFCVHEELMQTVSVLNVSNGDIDGVQ